MVGFTVPVSAIHLSNQIEIFKLKKAAEAVNENSENPSSVMESNYMCVIELIVSFLVIL